MLQKEIYEEQLDDSELAHILEDDEILQQHTYENYIDDGIVMGGVPLMHDERPANKKGNKRNEE